MVEITKEIQIDYGHTLPDHFSFCNQIHGHRARIVAHFTGDIKTEGSERGMVIDFGICKKVMLDKIHAVLDHGFAVWKNDTDEFAIYPDIVPDRFSGRLDRWEHSISPRPITTLRFIQYRNKKYLICDEPPTAEYLAKWAYHEIEKGLREYKREDVSVIQLDWWETPNNCAIYIVSRAGFTNEGIESFIEVDIKDGKITPT